MAHIREKLGFCQGGRFRRFLGLAQFLLDLFAIGNIFRDSHEFLKPPLRIFHGRKRRAVPSP